MKACSFSCSRYSENWMEWNDEVRGAIRVNKYCSRKPMFCRRLANPKAEAQAPSPAPSSSSQPPQTWQPHFQSVVHHQTQRTCHCTPTRSRSFPFSFIHTNAPTESTSAISKSASSLPSSSNPSKSSSQSTARLSMLLLRAT